MAKILDGKKLSQDLTPLLKNKVGKLKTKPKLVIIQIGNNAESGVYIRNKINFGNKIGVLIDYKQYSAGVSENKIISDVRRYNHDKKVRGVMVQLPIPKNLSKHKILNAIDPARDVDGLTAESLKNLLKNEPGFMPATTKGILVLLDRYKINLTGKKVVVVGESPLVGRPTALAFLNRKATVTICHAKTEHLEEETKRADIIVTAAGVPNLITKKHVSKGQVIVDIGITITKDKKVVGDVDYESVKDIVGAITPVPGGVGPMTVYSLFENLIEAV